MNDTFSRRSALATATAAAVTAALPAGVPATLGQRLTHARLLAGLSIHQAAKQAKVSPADWHAWENDAAEPNVIQGLAVARLLRCDPHWLAAA